ncbi:MAG: GNAT family N-acetyltransferase [Pseudomonadota bacterium]|nr:GNAT family N-acetyltransferase [Pseudomonadota bacterium]
MTTPAARIERTQWDLFWVPPDVTVVDRPDLLLVTCPRPAPYLNTVLRTRAPADALPALVAEVEGHMAGRRARWLVPDTIDRAPLERTLAARGWALTEQLEVRVLPVDAWRRPPSSVTVHAVDSLARLRDTADVTGTAFGRPVTTTDAELALDLRACTEGRRVHRFVAYDTDGTPIASGGLTAFPDVGFGLLWAGGVVPTARGRGAYTAVLAARIERARALGLREVGLYAKATTSAPIVARLGFGREGEMAYWESGGG